MKVQGPSKGSGPFRDLPKTTPAEAFCVQCPQIGLLRDLMSASASTEEQTTCGAWRDVRRATWGKEEASLVGWQRWLRLPYLSDQSTL